MTVDREPLERVSTGIVALDEILDGGVPRFATVFVAGHPGTGKTVLSQHALFANGQRSSPALYLTTLAEAPLKMMRHSRNFEFFDPTRVGREIIYNDVGAALAAKGVSGLMEEMDRLVRLHRPEFLVLDSFRVVKEYFDAAVTYRQFLYDFVLRLAAWEVTAFLVGEYSESEIRDEPEFAIADGILYLYGTDETARQRRFLRILKMRGTNFFAGEHFFEIKESGIELYPRLDPRIGGEYSVPSGRLPSAVPGLTDMMGGGIQEATSAVIVGTSGAGKSLVALSFLIATAQLGKPALYVTFEERGEQLVRNAEQLGWPIRDYLEQGLLQVIHVPPSELDIDKHAIVIKQAAAALKAQTVIIDTISVLYANILIHSKAQDYLWAITDYFKRVGVTVIDDLRGPTGPDHRAPW